MLPQVIDTFSSIIAAGRYESNSLILFRFFKNILNPHIWSSKILVKSLFGFLKSLILNNSYVFKKKEIISICCVVQMTFFDHCDNEYYFSFLICFLDVIEREMNFMPHFLEMIFNIQKNVLKNKFHNYFYIFSFLLAFKVGLVQFIKICDKIQKNCFLNLIQFSSPQFVFLFNNLQDKNILLNFSDVFFNNILNSEFFYLKKVIEKFTRQLICVLKVVENEIDSINYTNFNKHVRFESGYGFIDKKNTLDNKARSFFNKIKNFVFTYIA
jgi:hypothetical protein